MATPSLLTGVNAGPHQIAASVEPAGQSGARAKLLRFAKMLSACIGKRRRRPAVESYIPGKSHEDESRLEVQRFLYW